MLVVEDETIVALGIEQLLEELGCKVVGPASGLIDGVALASDQDIDLALLNVKLRGADCYPVAKVLDQRGIPFGFVTGYRVGQEMGKYRGRPATTKPFDKAELKRLLRKLL